MPLKRIAIFASGSGSNAQRIMEHFKRHKEMEVAIVLSNRADSYVLQRADNFEIPTHVFSKEELYDSATILQLLKNLDIDIIVLAGFMRVLSNSFLSQFPNQVINIHPALPEELPGTRAIERAFVEFTQGSRHSTGVMVHFVPDEGVDNGPVIAQQTVPIHAADTLVTLEARMHATEHALVIDALQQLITQQKAPAS